MQQMDRREFILKSSRWIAGAGALYLAGTFISCSSTEDSASVASSQSSTSEKDETSAGNDAQTPLAEDGASGIAVVVSEKCIGCGKCARGICPHNAISMAGDLAVIGAACNGCGRCVGVCPRNAIELSGELSSSRGSGNSIGLAAPGGQAAAA
jgi:ferredoxin